MVGNCYARIKGGNPYAYVVVLVLLLTPILGWGQLCPSYTNTLTSANVTTTSSGGVASGSTLTITSAASLATAASSKIVVSGKLELMFTNTASNDFTTGDNSVITVCSGGVLVISGNLFLGNKADLVVQTGGFL